MIFVCYIFIVYSAIIEFRIYCSVITIGNNVTKCYRSNHYIFTINSNDILTIYILHRNEIIDRWISQTTAHINGSLDDIFTSSRKSYFKLSSIASHIRHFQCITLVQNSIFNSSTIVCSTIAIIERDCTCWFTRGIPFTINCFCPNINGYAFVRCSSTTRIS